MSARRRLLPWGLFALAPFVGEFVLGNVAVTQAWSYPLLAPMYGGGALLVREVGRRRGGWPVMITLGAVYALVEEGLIDQMLFNPAYLGLDDFADHATVLGTSATLTVESLSIHAVWSIGVPIAIMEAFDPEPPRPWLRRRGLLITTAVFVVGSAALTVMQYDELRFVGSPAQFGFVGALLAVLAAAAVWLARERPAAATVGRPAPSVRAVGVTAFALSTSYWVLDLGGPSVFGPWPVIAAWAVLVAACAVTLLRCSRRPGWGPAHRLAVAGGVLVTYVWAAFVNTAFLGVPLVVGLVGNVVFGAAAVAILVLAVRAERRRPAAGVGSPVHR